MRDLKFTFISSAVHLWWGMSLWQDLILSNFIAPLPIAMGKSSGFLPLHVLTFSLLLKLL